MRFGDLEGTVLRGHEATEESRNSLATNNANMCQDKDFAWPGGGESTGQVEERALRGLQSVYGEFPEAECVVIVAHGRFNKICLASLLYGDALRSTEIQQGNTCINVIDQLKDGSHEEVLLGYMEHVRREEQDL
jgi:broad specificity phosphatase PhoE